MFLDTTFNSTIRVLTNIYENFIESAMRFYRYAKCLPASKQPRVTILISKWLMNHHHHWRCSSLTKETETIEDLIELAFILTKSKSRQDKFEKFHCGITKSQVRWWVYLFPLFSTDGSQLCAKVERIAHLLFPCAQVGTHSFPIGPISQAEQISTCSWLAQVIYRDHSGEVQPRTNPATTSSSSRATDVSESSVLDALSQ